MIQSRLPRWPDREKAQQPRPGKVRFVLWDGDLAKVIPGYKPPSRLSRFIAFFRRIFA